MPGDLISSPATVSQQIMHSYVVLSAIKVFGLNDFILQV